MFLVWCEAKMLRPEGTTPVGRKKKSRKEGSSLDKEVVDEYVKTQLEKKGDKSSNSSGNPPPPRKKTAAELKFEEAHRKRLEAQAEQVAAKTHKEKVAEFNAYLEKLSEHHDLPKVGPG
jgi:protein FAM32A